MKSSLKAMFVVWVVMIVPVANAEYIASIGSAPIGGDELWGTSGKDLEAGAGIYGDIGVLHQPQDSVISYQVTFGLKFDFIDFNGGDASTFSVPLNAMVFYNNTNNFRFGAGVVYELGPEYSVDDESRRISSDIEFDDALGFAIELGYFLNEKAFLGARYTSIDYDMPDGQALVSTGGGAPITSVDANNLGIHIGIMF